MYCPVNRRHSRGVALITALLLVALITVSVTAMSVRQRTSIQRAGNQQIQSQLTNLLSAGEKFAMATLRRDKTEQERNGSDSTEDFWAESLPPVPVDGATVEGCIIDLNGKFNLNNLVDENGKVAEVEYEQLKLLLAALNIDTAKAEAIRDWIDRDIDATGAQGAEDDFYTGQTPSYRAANGDMVSPSELLLVRGFRVSEEGGLEDFDTLLPHIATLPTGTLVNVNTASGAVLASFAEYMLPLSDQLRVVDDEYWQGFPGCPEGGGLFDALTEGDDSAADPDADDQGSAVYEDAEDFRASARGDTEEQNLDNVLLDVKSEFFLARVTVTRDEASITQYTVMQRDNTGAIRVRQRTRNGY
jgi:general secretion pathway protein K